MRLFEVMTEARKVVSTRRFDKELPEFLKADPSIGRTLAAFLRFRETALPQQGYGKKDAVYTAGKMQGFRHVHLVHGKVIVTYQVTATEIRLISIHTHDATETSNGLPNYVSRLSPEDFHAFGGAQHEATPMTITPEQAKEALSALYDFASHPEDRKMLALVAQGQDVPEMWEMLRAMIGLDGGPEQDQMIVTGFGGPQQFQAKAAEVLKQTA